ALAGTLVELFLQISIGKAGGRRFASLGSSRAVASTLHRLFVFTASLHVVPYGGVPATPQPLQNPFFSPLPECPLWGWPIIPPHFAMRELGTFVNDGVPYVAFTYVG